LPGDGDLPLATIVRHLRAIDYQGAVSVEIMNPQIWQIPVRQVADASISALRRVLQTEGL
jgi:4-hydroxyphenylpyruvate dioxygenase